MKLDIRLEAFGEPVGHLDRIDGGAVNFTYYPSYAERVDAVPLSLSLPLREAPFEDHASRPYFENLLQENDQLRQVIDRERLSRNDVAGILFHLGADCPGAVSCLPHGAPPIKIPGDLATDYDFLTSDDVASIMQSLADRERLPEGVRDPSPLAGVQPKVAVVVAPDGRYALPKQGVGAPTTHILKVPAHRDQREAELEVAAARLASACGLETAISQLVVFGNVSGVLSPRFDRAVSAGGSVRRIHQEDFAQALGLPSSLKYERHGDPRSGFSFAAARGVLAQCENPAVALETFLTATFFNLAIGNSDNHAKNQALVYDRARAPRLAPLYDLLPIRISDNYNHDFSFRIGEAAKPEELTAGDFALLFRQSGMTDAAALRFAYSTVADLLRKLNVAVEAELRGMKDFADLIGTESRRIVDVLRLEVELTERDYFAPRAPGWAAS